MREALKLAFGWAETHGKAVFAGGGISAVTGMNEWAAAAKKSLAQPEQEPVPHSGAEESPPVFARRWKLANDGFGLQRDDANGNYVDITDALSVLHQTLLQQPEHEPVAGTYDDAVWSVAMQKCGQLHGDKLHMTRAQIAAVVRACSRLAQPEQEMKNPCCNHDSDCAIHNGDALPVGPCNCSQTFVSSPDLGIVTAVAYQLAQRELNRLVDANFGRMPRNDEWADKVLLVRDTFEAAHDIKKTT